jgi:hypothetical protein
MHTSFRRLLTSLVLSSLLMLTLSAVASANIASKSIDTTTGACTDNTSGNDPEPGCGSAVYGAQGFTGIITFDAAPAGQTIVDYICTHTPGDGPFVSYTKGGTYTLTIYNDDSTVNATATNVVIGGIQCTGSENAVDGGAAAGATIAAGTTDTTLKYSITIQGVTPESASTDFPTCGPSTPPETECFNSIRNRALSTDGSHADSPSVKPPTTPPGEIPESPFSALLVLTAGVGVAWFVSRRLGTRALPGLPA